MIFQKYIGILNLLINAIHANHPFDSKTVSQNAFRENTCHIKITILNTIVLMKLKTAFNYIFHDSSFQTYFRQYLEYLEYFHLMKS